MNKQDFALSWYAVPTVQDWTNLTISGCKRVLLSFGLARAKPDMLARLVGMNCRAVLRIEQTNADSPSVITDELRRLSFMIPIDAVILGVEPDTGIDFTYASPNWGQSRAYAHRLRANDLMSAVMDAGLPAVAPAMTWPPEMISEDGILQPGRTTWREIVAGVYQRAAGVASHCGYVLGWDGNAINAERFKFGLKRACEEWHKPLWIDEATFPTDDDVLQMKCAIELAAVIMSGSANDRVKLLSPFCSAGTPGGYWPAAYLIKDPKAYELLARWLAS